MVNENNSGGKTLQPVTLYEKGGLKVSATGDFTKEELEILVYEVKATLSDILKSRRYRGGLK